MRALRLTSSGALLAAVAVAVAASGCGGSKAAAARVGGGPCGRAAAAGAAGFLTAIGDGRVGAAERAVATVDFVWLVLGARAGGTGSPAPAANRAVLVRQHLQAYLRARVRQHDRFRLDSVRVMPPVTDGHLGFELAAYRRADDLAGGRRLPFVAKGEWRCRPGLLRGLAGHADLRGGPLPADSRCPAGAARVAGARVC